MLAACGTNSGNEKKGNEENSAQYNDVALFDLKGDVRMCVTTYFVENDQIKDTTAFDEKGRMTMGNECSFVYGDSITGKCNANPELTPTLKRDANDRVVSLSYKSQGLDFMIISYYYDSYGRVGGKILEQPGMSMRTIFEYNDENKLIAEHNQVANIESSEGAVETHVNYEYISFDEKGNWTEVLRTETNGADIVNDKITRQITYYK